MRASWTNRRGCTAVVAVAAAVAISAAAAPAHDDDRATKKLKGAWTNPIGACVQHVVSFDPATGDITCTGTSVWTGTWKGSTTWTLTGNQDTATGALSGRIDEVFRGRAADGRKGRLTFVEHLTIDTTGKTFISGRITDSCGALAGSHGKAHWVGTSEANGSGEGTYSGRWREGRDHERCRAQPSPRGAMSQTGP